MKVGLMIKDALTLILVGCSTEDETIETVNSFDSASIQRQLVGRWVYFIATAA